MIRIRPSHERGHADHGWLDTRYSFSFADYWDPRYMGFRSLRVINEDKVAPGRGFGTHPHKDMEIVTYVLSGGLAHKDSMGNAGTIRPGEVQRMSAGTGVTHSEYNASDSEETHLLQIWIIPEKRGNTPSYEQKQFPVADRTGTLRVVAAPDGRDGAVTIHQDASIYAALLEPKQSVTHTLQPGRHAWLQVIRGNVTLNGEALTAGDGAAVSEETKLELAAQDHSEVLLFDLA